MATPYGGVLGKGVAKFLGKGAAEAVEVATGTAAKNFVVHAPDDVGFMIAKTLQNSRENSNDGTHAGSTASTGGVGTGVAPQAAQVATGSTGAGVAPQGQEAKATQAESQTAIQSNSGEIGLKPTSVSWSEVTNSANSRQSIRVRTASKSSSSQQITSSNNTAAEQLRDLPPANAGTSGQGSSTPQNSSEVVQREGSDLPPPTRT